MTKETVANSGSGFALAFILLVLQIAGIVALEGLPNDYKPWAVVWTVAVGVCWLGFYLVQPNQARVLQLFGRYVGTDRVNGLRWANPLFTKKAVSLRVRNFESGRLKVNDANGNPDRNCCGNSLASSGCCRSCVRSG